MLIRLDKKDGYKKVWSRILIDDFSRIYAIGNFSYIQSKLFRYLVILIFLYTYLLFIVKVRLFKNKQKHLKIGWLM